MTAQEFVDKWPDAARNTKFLADMACEECGNRSNFRIELEQVARLTDDGPEHIGEADWTPNSWCMCANCETEGDAKNFVYPGLDDLLARRERAVTFPHA